MYLSHGLGATWLPHIESTVNTNNDPTRNSAFADICDSFLLFLKKSNRFQVLLGNANLIFVAKQAARDTAAVKALCYKPEGRGL
jgi:hypothetical protein